MRVSRILCELFKGDCVSLGDIQGFVRPYLAIIVVGIHQRAEHVRYVMLEQSSDKELPDILCNLPVFSFHNYLGLEPNSIFFVCVC